MAELDELVEVLLDVQAAGVVLVEEPLEALVEVDAGGVESGQVGDPSSEHRAQLLGGGPLTAACEHRLDRVPIHLAEIHEGLALLGADEVGVGGHGLVEELLDLSHDARYLGTPAGLADAVHDDADDLADRGELVGALVGEDRLEEALDPGRAFEEAGGLLVREHELVADVLQGLDPLELAQRA